MASTAPALQPFDMSNDRLTTKQAPSPSSPIYDDTVLTEDQWITLASIVDTVIAPPSESIEYTREAQFAAAVDIIKANTAVVDEALVSTYLSESASSCPGFREAIFRFLAVQVDNDARKRLLVILNALT